jgi:hypothetical protein
MSIETMPFRRAQDDYIDNGQYRKTGSEVEIFRNALG